MHRRCHDPDKHGKLNVEQKKELYKWRQANPEAAKRGRKQPKKEKGRPKSYTQKQISSLINKAVATVKGHPAKPEPTPPSCTECNVDVMSVLTEIVALPMCPPPPSLIQIQRQMIVSLTCPCYMPLLRRPALPTRHDCVNVMIHLRGGET